MPEVFFYDLVVRFFLFVSVAVTMFAIIDFVFQWEWFFIAARVVFFLHGDPSFERDTGEVPVH